MTNQYKLLVFILNHLFFCGSFVTAQNNSWNLSTNARQELLLLKLDSNGTIIWVKQGQSDSVCYGFMIDEDGGNSNINFFVKGSTVADSSTIQSQNYNSNGASINGIIDSTVIFKGASISYNPSYVSFGRTSVSRYGERILVGSFRGVLRLGGSGSYESNGESDIYVVKYKNGMEWIKVLGGSGEEGVYHVSVDSMKNIYVAGYFSGSLTFSNDTSIEESQQSQTIISGEESINGNDLNLFDVDVFPNPASNVVSLLCSGDDLNSNGGNLELMDITGRVIAEKRDVALSSVFLLDVSAYTPGLYYLQVNFGVHIKRIKVIKY